MIAKLIIWRLIQLPVLLLVIYTVTFALAWIVPGDPFKLDEGRRPPKEIEQAMKARYNLDSPSKFYVGYISDVVTKLDFGPSLQYRDMTVGKIIQASFPVSVQLGTAAILIALVVGTITGTLGAVKRGGILDWSTMGIALMGISLPTFVTGSVLLTVFGLTLRWVPVAGWDRFSHVILPALTLSLPFAAYIARLTRLGMLDVLKSDFVRTARAKGLSERVVLTKHALKVAFLPVLSFLGPAAAGAMTGSFVVERVFSVPGMGQHFVAAVQNKDQTLIMGVVLVYATMLILFNLAVDVAYHLVDPRIEFESND